MSGSQLLLLGGTPQVVSDPNFEYTTLLLPGNGTNGAQNNTFLDSSTNNFTITRNGNTTQGTFSPFSQTGWGNYFDGTGDSIKISSGITNQFAPGSAFTCEGWFYLTNSSASQMLFCVGGSTVDWNATTGILFQIYLFSGTLYWQSNAGGSANSLSGTCPSLNAWHHIAVGYNGTTTRVWVDGTSFASGTTSYSVPSYSNAMVGSDVNNGNNFYGYASNVRFVKGTDVYGAGNTSITVLTTPLTAITNTQLLTCQSNRFIDNSTNAFAITRNGDVSVQAFSPFNPTAAWSAATNGGSGYFDGSGDYLVAPDNAALEPGSSNLTWEMWINTTSSTQYATLYSRTTASFASGMWSLMINFASSTAGDVALFVGDFSAGSPLLQTTGVNVRDNAWHHIAVVRNGSSWVIYVDGVSRATATFSGTIADIAGGPYVGADQFYGRNFLGYISGLRIVKGTAVYTSGFTPPTAPPTAITNTSLLLNYANAGIYDATSKNDLETVGNAQISTTQSKFGGSSMLFDGTGDYLTPPSGQNFVFGSGGFTIECWVYPTTFSAFRGIIDSRAVTTNNTGFLLCLANASTGAWAFYKGSTLVVSATTNLTLNTWQHIAVVRNGTTITLYLNGTSVGSATDSQSFTDTVCRIGSTVDNIGWFGYIDDLRITKGIARYTANFTAPTAAFPLL